MITRILSADQTQIVPIYPAVLLINPKFPRNFAEVLRAASAFSVKQIWFTGTRLLEALEQEDRLPRELRLAEYRDVQLIHSEKPFNYFEKATPVAVEFRENAAHLPAFPHPGPRVLYVFGPEDGSIPQADLKKCHMFIRIPTRHCVNLSAAVYITLYDRAAKGEHAFS